MKQLTLFQAAPPAWEARIQMRGIRFAAEYCVEWYDQVRVRTRWREVFVQIAADAKQLEAVCWEYVRRARNAGVEQQDRWKLPLSETDAAAVEELCDRYETCRGLSSQHKMQQIPDNDAAWKSKKEPLWSDPNEAAIPAGLVRANCPELARQSRSRQRELVGV